MPKCINCIPVYIVEAQDLPGFFIQCKKRFLQARNIFWSPYVGGILICSSVYGVGAVYGAISKLYAVIKKLCHFNIPSLFSMSSFFFF